MGRYPWAEILLFKVLHIVAFYPTRQHAHRVVVFTAMICVATQIYQTPEVTNPLTTTYSVGCGIAFFVTFTAYLLFLEEPFPGHWRRTRDEVHAKADAGGSSVLPSDFPLTKKLWWMIDIAHNARLIGLVNGPQDHLPPHPPPSRLTFLKKTFLKLIINIIITDLASSISTSTPAFDSRLHDPTDGPETYLAAVPLLGRVPYVLGCLVMLGTSMSGIHNVVALVCVGLGYSNPTLWPDICGRWRDAYTVRKIWGKTWHQLMRQAFVGWGRVIANKILKFPRGTNRSSYTQLYVAFFLSGLFHFGGDFLIQRRMVFNSFKFFLLQAVVITFEDFVIYIAKGLLRQRGIEFKQGKFDESWEGAVLRVVGYCWVTLWFCLTLPVWLDELSARGYSSMDKGPIAQFLLGTWKQRS